MCENPNTDIEHTAGKNCPKNRLCEKNHAVIDSMVTCTCYGITKIFPSILHWYGQFMQMIVCI